MTDEKPKAPRPGAAKRLRELYKENRGRASSELLEILSTPQEKTAQDKRSAEPGDEHVEL